MICSLRKAVAMIVAVASSAACANEFLGSGQCPSGAGTLAVVTTGPYKGRTFDLKKNDSFRRNYAKLVDDPNHWGATLSGPAEENRRFSSAKGSFIVFFSCDARNCSSSQLYGVIDERTGAIGVRLFENGRVTDKGGLRDEGKSAIACAKALDEQAAKRAEETTKRSSKR